MKPESLASNIKRKAFFWTLAGVALTLALGGLLSFGLMLRDTVEKAKTEAASAVSMDRTDLLGGTDVRALELSLRKQFGIKDGEQLLFLDENRKPWVGDLKSVSLLSCQSDSPCRNWANQKIAFEKPIYFDDEGKKVWGYLHIERKVEANWALIVSIALAVIVGAFCQALGLYLGTRRSIQQVSGTLHDWAERLSANPKGGGQYYAAPFVEIEPIGAALSGLKAEIDALEHTARQQGALTTLRGVGHDILNPVARMKRLLGLLEPAQGAEAEYVASLRANLKRLSGYAEQLKLIYKRQSGEEVDTAPVTDVSREIRELARELLGDPETIEKNLKLEVEILDGCQVKIPAPALGRLIENLCSNSIHASLEGATVRLKVASSGNSVSIHVEDTGGGIPAECQEKIFEPNFTTKANRGTGLGLYVVKNVCEQYGGRVSFLSKPGATAFTLEFPKIEVSHGV